MSDNAPGGFRIHIDVCMFETRCLPCWCSAECPNCVRVSNALYTLTETWVSTPATEDHLLSGIISDHMTDRPETPDGEHHERLLTVFRRFHAVCFANNGKAIYPVTLTRTRSWQVIWNEVFPDNRVFDSEDE